jgi:hypothetical protein
VFRLVRLGLLGRMSGVLLLYCVLLALSQLVKVSVELDPEVIGYGLPNRVWEKFQRVGANGNRPLGNHTLISWGDCTAHEFQGYRHKDAGHLLHNRLRCRLTFLVKYSALSSWKN